MRLILRYYQIPFILRFIVYCFIGFVIIDTFIDELFATRSTLTNTRGDVVGAANTTELTCGTCGKIYQYDIGYTNDVIYNLVGISLFLMRFLPIAMLFTLIDRLIRKNRLASNRLSD